MPMCVSEVFETWRAKKTRHLHWSEIGRNGYRQLVKRSGVNRWTEQHTVNNLLGQVAEPLKSVNVTRIQYTPPPWISQYNNRKKGR